MQEVMRYPSGTFAWADLATTDTAAARQFYTQLFGWQAHDMPAGPDSVYTMLLLEGKEVAGLYEMAAEQKAQHIPPYWLSYVSVDDLDSMAAKAQSLNGTILLPPMDVMDAGRMALVQDPTGAIFGMWQPGQHIGAKLVNIPGTLCWNELATTSTDQAGAFYTALFGWQTSTSTSATGMPYIAFHNQGRMAAGMMQIAPEWGEMPPNWSVYFAVEDCDATVARARELGATIEMEPMEIPDTGRFAVVQDPQGAVFMVIKMYVADPPPGYTEQV